MKTESLPTRYYLKNYKATEYKITKVELSFMLDESKTIVCSKLYVVKSDPLSNEPLILDGEGLELKNVSIDSVTLNENQYTLTKDALILTDLPSQCIIESTVVINPKLNTSLTGLYVSSGNFCTQCESHGFRRITYFIDRPDNLSVFTISIKAPKHYNYLLSNGNLVDSGEEGGLHWAKWHDPFPKPSYLFALVAGNFDQLKDTFTTRSGKLVDLSLYVEEGKKSQAGFAMDVLKKAMKWDEDNYDREYDLNQFMTVAVSDFNFGAMENKGLNVFNARYILANSKTATDQDFLGIDRVVAHEYFHNWSGNRVTCRDWFQLSLKEGLTVFREHDYMSSMAEQAVMRIQEAKFIQTFQFQEDAGPMSHPIRPDSYIEMNNFYTATVYEKGSEVIRMIRTIIGKESFRRAVNVYFDTYDGQAVTTDDFVEVMEKVSKTDLSLFRKWYSMAGTPVCKLTSDYDSEGILTIAVSQSIPSNLKGLVDHTMHIPMLMSFVTEEGICSASSLDGYSPNDDNQFLIELKEGVSEFKFTGFSSQPILSVLDEFSAPIKIEYDLSINDRLMLVKHSPDGYQRWFQMNQIWYLWVEASMNSKECLLPSELVKTYDLLLSDPTISPGLVAEVLTIPTDRSALERMPESDITQIHNNFDLVKSKLSKSLKPRLIECYERMVTQVPYVYSSDEIGRRSLKMFCLSMLACSEEESAADRCISHYKNSDNMTDAIGSLTALTYSCNASKEALLQDFYDKWHNEELVLNKWFALQARTGSLEAIKALMKHKDYDSLNPNKSRSLLGQFAHFNTLSFHKEDGTGYMLLADAVMAIQKNNPQLAAGLLGPLIYWKRFDKIRQRLMKDQLQRIFASQGLSNNLYELIKSSIQV